MDQSISPKAALYSMTSRQAKAIIYTASPSVRSSLGEALATSVGLDELTDHVGFPAALEQPCQVVEDLATDKLRAFGGTVNLKTGVYLDDVYAQNKSLSEHVAADYHGRFLIELIQNGNDAHERHRRDGEIQVLLVEDEGEHGTLYVANRGNPFAKANLVALSRIGMSSKPPGEAIGNKGLGFRSVSHVCDAPEIYSQAATPGPKPEFDGFCFTFAQRHELGGLISDERVLELAQFDLPIFFLPRPLHVQGPTVRGYAERGFASVVRLPLRDATAKQAALDEMTSLGDDTAPLLLFLDRLKFLFVRVTNLACQDRLVLNVKREEHDVANATVAASVVSLGPADWLVVRDSVAEPVMQDAIAAGVAAKQLHGSWTDWKGIGEVALGVRLDGEVESPRLYTFLPMGEGAAAPFPGHLHGSFFPTSNRKALDAGVALNRLLLRQAASLAAASVRWLAGLQGSICHPALDAASRARASADLLTWSNPPSLVLGQSSSVERIDLPRFVAEAVGWLGSEAFESANVVPCAAARMDAKSTAVGWRPPVMARSGFDASQTFDLSVVARHGEQIGVAPLWPGLGPARLQRVAAYLRTHAPGAFRDRLAPAERALIAASVAATLRAGRRPALAQWTVFYRDLPSFIDDAPAALAGHRIILCDDGSVRAGRHEEEEDSLVIRPRTRRRRRRGEQIEPSLFFPPAPRPVGDAKEPPLDQLTVPKQLAEYFAFAASDLPWHGELRKAREFLEEVLVSAYDGETVLTRIAQVVNSGASVEGAIAGLRWAFAIWRRAVEVNRPIKIDRSYRLLVPTAEQELIPATEAVFSETWPEETLGKRLHAFLSAAPSDVPDLAKFRTRRLAPTSHRAFARARIPQWTVFLRDLGVGRGLQSVPLPPMPAKRAYEVTSLTFASTLGISDAAAAEWRSDLAAYMQESLSLAYSTNYEFVGPLWWLPGQGDHQRFSEECREIYAGLVIEWLARAPENSLRVTLVHEYFTSDAREWSTPVGAFLRSATWVPADDPSPAGPVRSHYRPCDVWVAGNDRFPFYLRQIAVSLGKVIERAPPDALERLVGKANLRILNAGATLLDQVRFLAEQFACGAVSRHYEPQLVNLYNATWKAITDRQVSDLRSIVSADARMPLLVRRSGELAMVVPGIESGQLVYVRDTDDEIAPSLVASLDGSMLDIKGADRRRVGQSVEAIYGNRVSRLSEMQYDVRVDGIELDQLEPPLAVATACPWLRPMLAVAMEGLKGPDASQLPSDRGSLLARLANVKLQPASQVTFEINGQPVAVPRPAYMFRRSDGAPLVVMLHTVAIGWAALDRCLPAICEAIELPSVTTGMRLLARELASNGEDVDNAVLDDEAINRLCRTLYLEDAATTAARLLVGERSDARVPWIRAALHYAGGTEALAACHAIELTHGDDAQALIGSLMPLAASAGLDPDRLLEACRRAFTTEQFRELLDFDFATFNASLLASGSDPVTHPALHASQLVNYITEHEIAILEALRNTAAALLDNLEPAPNYARNRDKLRSLAPDPDWLQLYLVVPEDIVLDHVARWLAKAGAPPLGANPHGLPPLQETRAANVGAIGRLANTAAPLVRAWWRGPAGSLPEFWCEGRAAEQRLRTTLDAAGVVDFRPMDESELLAWCKRLGMWPDGMPATLDPATLGLGDEQVDAAEEAARREAAERAAKARAVRFNGRDIDPEEADWTKVSIEIAAGLSRQVKRMRLGMLTPLKPIERRDWHDPTRREPRRTSAAPDRTPQAKKDMIGRLGELVVYHWLKDRFRNQDIDKAWVSKNGALQNGKEGSDELGHDFELEHDRRTWLMEVKASQGDSCRFEMGESEVRAARSAARPRSGKRYVVIYVADPGNSDATRIDILPNPMSEEADGVLDLLGEGVRYGFRRH
jgi:Domain of unknown function (DUF3883)